MENLKRIPGAWLPTVLATISLMWVSEFSNAAISAHDSTDKESNGSISSTAQFLLGKSRPSIVQIRVFYGTSTSHTSWGTGFATSDSGAIVTNYHVVSPAVLHPTKYRLEYVDATGNHGPLQIRSLDVEHDLAIVAGDTNNIPGLKLRSQIPERGEQGYSIGFPLGLGLTITEGVTNGLVENAREPRIHFSGALNHGMSGGPSLDSNGKVYGVNVATSGQSVGYLVPVKHVEALLSRSQQPINPDTARRQVESQLKDHQSLLFASFANKLPTQHLSGFDLPFKLAPFMTCASNGESNRSESLRIETSFCESNSVAFAEEGLEIGFVNFNHKVFRNKKLHPMQFAAKVEDQQNPGWVGEEKHVTPFSCRSDAVKLNGFAARVSTCVRAYRMFGELYDIGLVVTSLNDSHRALVSKLYLRGVEFDSGMNFTRRYLEAMRWNPWCPLR